MQGWLTDMARIWELICKCDECGHKWIQESGLPKRCPSRDCRSSYWDSKFSFTHARRDDGSKVELGEWEKNRILSDKSFMRQFMAHRRESARRNHANHRERLWIGGCAQCEKEAKALREKAEQPGWANAPADFPELLLTSHIARSIVSSGREFSKGENHDQNSVSRLPSHRPLARV